MTKFQRIKNLLLGLMMAGIGVEMLRNPQDAFSLIAVFLAATLILSGARRLFYYLFMARHMTGGRAILFIGLFVLDFGVFTVSVIDEPRFYIITYLIAFHVFTGVLNMLKAIRELRQNVAGWKIDMAQGLVNLAMAAACVIFKRDVPMLVGLYCCGVFYAAGVRIVSAFRRSAIVYVP